MTTVTTSANAIPLTTSAAGIAPQPDLDQHYQQHFQQHYASTTAAATQQQQNQTQHQQQHLVPPSPPNAPRPLPAQSPIFIDSNATNPQAMFGKLRV